MGARCNQCCQNQATTKDWFWYQPQQGLKARFGIPGDYEPAGVEYPEAHVNAVAQDKSNGSKEPDEKVRSQQKNYRRDEHTVAVLVYRTTVSSCVCVAFSDAIDPKKQNRQTVNLEQKYWQRGRQVVTSVEPQKQGGIGLSEHQDYETQRGDHRAHVLQYVRAF